MLPRKSNISDYASNRAFINNRHGSRTLGAQVRPQRGRTPIYKSVVTLVRRSLRLKGS